ncbi:glutaredoxin family protein [Oceanobacillus sp. 143]|uniref:Glutaredoxin family protein n=1 Tax=Oceanobacillus zhaokaii TaxID=2052660 RepID=A0A345PIX3_9BACI|nr:glutaredoxin family protein [Oceanobacillus zhaokaii]AXI09953.1 glutaredoxin family protein [Oceanobacillus zhaokaii]QGS69145.1 glutaredoxin family protein [Oceanobacillus sp. 143]
MLKIILYTKENCTLCIEAESLLSLFKKEYPYELEKKDIYENDALLEEYQLLIPVIELNGKQLNCVEINYDSVENLLIENNNYGVGG